MSTYEYFEAGSYPDNWRFIVALVNRDNKGYLSGLIQLYEDGGIYRLVVNGVRVVTFDRDELIELRNDLNDEIDFDTWKRECS